MAEYHDQQHAEVYAVAERSVRVRCECPIGRDHSHEEWLERFAGVRDSPNP